MTLDPVSIMPRARRNPRGGPRQGENILWEKKQPVFRTRTLSKILTLAQAIITGGTMTLLLLAASLVTTTFLMSPVIEKFLGWEMLHQHYFLLSISDEEGISDTSSIKVNISETARYQEWRQTFIVLNEKAKIRILSSPCPKSYSQTPQVPINRALTKNLKSKKE